MIDIDKFRKKQFFKIRPINLLIVTILYLFTNEIKINLMFNSTPATSLLSIFNITVLFTHVSPSLFIHCLACEPTSTLCENLFKIDQLNLEVLNHSSIQFAKSKFEANRSRDSLVMIGHTNKRI